MREAKHPDVASGAPAVSNRATAAKDSGTMDGGASLGGRGRQPLLPGVAELPKVPASKEDARAYWLNRLYPALADLSPDALRIAEAALQACPVDPTLL